MLSNLFVVHLVQEHVLFKARTVDAHPGVFPRGNDRDELAFAIIRCTHFPPEHLWV